MSQQLTPLRPLDVPLFAPRNCTKCDAPTDWIVGGVALCSDCVINECRVKREMGPKK